jgi:hypothetical protein
MAKSIRWQQPKTFGLVWGLWLLVMAIWLAPDSGRSQEYLNQMDTLTQDYFGASCSRLAELSRLEIKALVHRSNEEFFAEFCYPDRLMNCSDYDNILHGMGHLKRQDGYACRFVPPDHPSPAAK